MKTKPLPMQQTEISRPKLLVSVRNTVEAKAAINGGCDLLDIKEPANGSLGMADITTITDICKTVSRTVPISAALGETTDWLASKTVPVLPTELSFVKLGTAQLSQQIGGLKNWTTIRQRLDETAEHRFQWIAVCYADWQRAAAPPPNEIIAAACESSCHGILFDTFIKDGQSLFDYLTPQQLTEFIEPIRNAKLLTAIAGSLTLAQIKALRNEPFAQIQPSIVAVRSAACEQQYRTGSVTTAATTALKKALQNTGN